MGHGSRWWAAMLGGLLLGAATPTAIGQQAPAPASAHPTHGASTPSAGAGAAEPASLSLAALEQMAMQANPTLAQAAARIDMARGNALQAGLPFNPTLAYRAEQVGVAGTAGEFQGVVISQEIVTAGKLRLSRAKYEQQAVQAEIQALAQDLRVRNAVRLRYYDVAAAQRVVEARTRLLQVSEEGLKATRQLVNVGAANRPDLLQAEVEERRARLDLKSARTRLEGEWARLAATVGDPRLAQVPLDGPLELDGPPPDWDRALCDLLDASPEMQLVRAEAVRDEIALRREQAEPYPNVRLQAGVGYNHESRNTVADAQVGIRVPLFDRNQGTIRHAKAELARAHAEVRRMELSLRERFADAATRYRTARATAEEYRSEILPRAREAHALLLDSFRSRRAAWPQVLVAERTWAQLSVEYVEALHGLRKADVEIRGLLLTDGLAQPPGPTPQGHLDATPRPR